MKLIPEFKSQVVQYTKAGLTMREFTNKDLVNPWLKYQAGELEVRPVAGRASATEGIFTLLGYGVTEADALAMAGVRA